MIKDILKIMVDGEAGLTEIGQRLGLTSDQMDSRIETMVRMGYIEEVKASSACGEARYCMGCAFARKGKGNTCSESMSRSFFITEKGRSALKR